MSNIKASKDIGFSTKGTVVLLQHYRYMKWNGESLKTHMVCELTSGWNNLSEGLDWLLEFAPEGKRRQYESYLSKLVDYQALVDTIDVCVKKMGTCPGTGKDYETIIRSKFIDGEIEVSDEDCIEYCGLPRNKFYKLKKQAIEILTIFIWTAIDGKCTDS